MIILRIAKHAWKQNTTQTIFKYLLRQCTTKYETKIQEALLIKQHNPKLNAQLYGGGSSILLNVF